MMYTSKLGFLNGGLLGGEPREYLRQGGKLNPSSFSYLLDETDRIINILLLLK